ncbi:hypothetical protein ADL26_05080 [Thermoactinomyces vulgaris]|nr:hypothetical protein ADL26_05080 [Thermoactinomyces vulgaris]
MQKGKLIFIFTITVISTILAACSNNQIDLDLGKFGIVYTDSLKDDSEFSVIDANGTTKSSQQLDVTGIYQIASDGRGGYFLPSELTSSLVHIDQKGKITTSKNFNVHNYINNQYGYQVTLFNTNVDINTLEIKYKNKIKRLNLPSFARMATFDSNYVYVFCDTESKSYIYVIGLRTGKIIRKIPVKKSGADDMDIFHGQIVSPPSDANFLITLDPKNWKVQYRLLPHNNPDRMVADHNYLYVSTKEGYIMKLNQNYEVEKSTKSNPLILNMLVDKENLYVLSQIQSDQYAGYIITYDKNTLKIKQKISLPNIRDTLVQSFILLDQKERKEHK